MEQSLLITVSIDELKMLIKSAVREVIKENPLTNSLGKTDEVMDAIAAAAYLRIKISTLYSKSSKRLLPHFKKGKKLYFRINELIKYIDEGKIKTQSDLKTEASNYCLQHSKNKRIHKTSKIIATRKEEKMEQ